MSAAGHPAAPGDPGPGDFEILPRDAAPSTGARPGGGSPGSAGPGRTPGIAEPGSAEPGIAGSGIAGSGGAGSGGAGLPEDTSVGSFRQGNLGTQMALGRYLVGRVIAARISAGLMVTALVILALAAVDWFIGPHWLAVLIALLALPVLLARAVARWFIDRVTEASLFAPAEDAVRRMIGQTGGDFRRELRRIGVPASMFGFPLLLARMMRGKSRRTLLLRMRDFEVDRVVPPSRVDELHMLIAATRRR